MVQRVRVIPTLCSCSEDVLFPYEVRPRTPPERHGIVERGRDSKSVTTRTMIVEI